MTEHLLIFLAGLAGSMHCVGMCGGFACALGTDTRGAAGMLLRRLLYNVGRLTSYVFLGAAAGAIGVALAGHDGSPFAQRMLALVSGALMVIIGLQFFGLFRRLGYARFGGATELLAQALRDLLRAPGPAAPLAFGVFNGLLPCPLVYAFAAQAAASGAPLAGMAVMLAFGLGTFPALLLTAWFATRVRAHATVVRAEFRGLRRGAGGVAAVDWRVHGVRVAGGFILLFGVITLARGVLPMSAHLH